MNLGLWTPYVDTGEMLSWYDLPAEMSAECDIYAPDGNELDTLPAKYFASLQRFAKGYADMSVARIAPAYHNPAHFRTVQREGMAALTTYQLLTGHKIPTAVCQLMSIALYTHDADHCGSTFRNAAPKPELLALPELGTSVSTEWVTALKVNCLLKDSGVVLPARMFQTKIHWASTYGGQTGTGRELGIPVPDPQDLYGCIMRAADVYPNANFIDWINASIAVNYGEIPAEVPPLAWQGFLGERAGFTSFIEHCFNRLDAAAGANLTQVLGWRTNLAKIRSELDKLLKGHSPLTETHIRGELAKYGVTLS